MSSTLNIPYTVNRKEGFVILARNKIKIGQQSKLFVWLLLFLALAAIRLGRQFCTKRYLR